MKPVNTLAKRTCRIKSLLALNGIRQTEIAAKMKVTPSAVHRVIESKKTSARIRGEIAARLGKSPAQLWPARRRK